MKIAILGFGTVGSSVARILLESEPSDVQITHIFNRSVERKKVDWVPGSVIWTEDLDNVLASGVDAVLELAGGLKPAGEWVRKALTAEVSVVTANKKLIAFHGPELEKLASQNGCSLLYGAAVAGGIPVIPGLQQGLAGDRIWRLEGILNGTCNFILSKMEDGADFEPVLGEAQSLGYAEADPTEDVAGYDARAKLAILMRLAMRVEVNLEDIPARPITEVAAIDFAYARELKCTIRQISRAELTGGQISAAVGPMLVPDRLPLAWSRGTENMVVFTGRYGGNVVFSGHGAGGDPTAVAVVSDVLTIANGSRSVEIPSQRRSVTSEPQVPHYIRFLVNDKPGIVAGIAGSLAEERININALLQKPGHPAERLPFVVTVEPCRNSALKRALARMSQMDCMLAPPLDLQMIGEEDQKSHST